MAESGDHLLRDGRDDVLIADTVWAGLHRAEPDRFARLLATRAAQGFTTVMLSLLPIAHDCSGEAATPTVGFDDAWWERAASLVGMVTEAGLDPMIMLQWVDYVPGSWASLDHPEFVMSDAQTLELVDAAVERLGTFGPIWSLSGDDTFTNPAGIERYRLIAQRVRERDPDALVTAHTGGWVNFPDAMAELVDFVGYQSGHDGANWGENPLRWNRYLAAHGRRMPRMNLEPPYEGHGFNGGEGRYTAREIRIASWRSLITGGGAGLAYGAHGLWSWHTEGQAFSSEDWSGMPFDVDVALGLPGANELGWLRDLAVEHRFWELADRGDLVVRDRSGITVGGTDDLSRLVVHAPHAFGFEVQVPHDAYRVDAWDAVAHEPVAARTRPGASGMLVVESPRELTEHAYVLTRRS